MIETAMLHHVTTKREVKVGPLADYAVTPGQLEAYLRDRSTWNPASKINQLEQLSEDQYVLMTFDDGYRNNLTEALPVLEAYDIPCLLFVTTGFIDGTIYPYELELAEVLERVDTLSIPGSDRSVDLGGRSKRRSLYRELRLPLKPKSHAEREDFMQRLARHNEYERSEMQAEPLLSWDEVRSLSEHPLVTIGAHTRSHALLSQQSWRVAYEEISASKRRLERQIGQPVIHFSYPYGGNDVVVRQMTRWVGYKYGFTTDARRTQGISRWNRFSLPRIDIGELIPDHE